MAIGIQCTFYFVVIFALQNGIGTALEFEIDPETFNEVVSDELSISCTLNGSIPTLKQVIMLEIYKTDKSPLAIIRQDEIISGPGLKPHMKAVGNIDKTTGFSHLKLTISNPDIEDAGTYTCLLFYLDDLYQLKEHRVYRRASVTVDQSDIQAVVTYLMGKVSVLDKKSKQQEAVISEQKDTINSQEDTLRRLGRQQRGLSQNTADKDKKHEAALSLLRDELTEQKTINEEHEMKLEQQNNSMNENKWKINSQNKQLMELEDLVTEQNANATYISAFSYSYNSGNTFSAGDTLIFSDLIMNIGNDYDPTTGIFTAPRNGLYSFHLVGMSYTGNVNLYIDLKVKSNIVATLYAYEYRGAAQSSVSSVASLMAGDKVWPTIRSGTGGTYMYTSQYFSVFTGYLLRLS